MRGRSVGSLGRAVVGDGQFEFGLVSGPAAALLFGVCIFVLSSCGDAAPSADVAVTFDTLASGAVEVRNAGPPLYLARADTFPLPRAEGTVLQQRTDAGVVSTTIPYAPRVTWSVVPDGTVWLGLTERYHFVHRTLEGDTLRMVELPVEPDPVTAEERREAMCDGHLYAHVRDELGVPYLVRFRIRTPA